MSSNGRPPPLDTDVLHGSPCEEWLPAAKEAYAAFEGCSRQLRGVSAARVVVYTAIFGGVDRLPAGLPLIPGLEYVCFSDDPGLASREWKIVDVGVRVRDTRRLARLFKLLPHRLFPDAERTVWVDGSVTLLPGFSGLATIDLSSSPIRCFAHPDRSCAYDEVDACIRFRKDPADILTKQAERYGALGFPRGVGLYATGVLVRRHRSTDAVRCMEAWANELNGHSSRDQISLPFVAWRHGLAIEPLPGTLACNEYVTWREHRRWIYYDAEGYRILNPWIVALRLYNMATGHLGRILRR